ncbi:MAG: hypothetical protein ABI643_03135 [Candidatus Doudnabacteria bacterium]
MNKKTLILLSAVLLVAAACNKQTAPTTNNADTSDNTSGQQQTSAKPTSLKGLLSAGDQICTYSDGQNSTVVYVASGKERVDITSKNDNVTTNMHTIMDGTASYTWIDGQTTGFKTMMNAQNNESLGQNPGASSEQQVDINRQLNYNCLNGSSDSSKFKLPANVKFMDLSTMKIPGQ